MYYVYVLENQNDRSFYIGFSSDLKRRLVEHQQGKGARVTKAKKNWLLIYLEGYLEQADALGRERFLKGGSGRRYLYKQLAHYLGSG